MKTEEKQINLIAVLTPHYYKKYENLTALISDVNGLFDYAIDLFNSISRKHDYCFGRSFSYDLRICQNQFIITQTGSQEADTESFLAFVALLQFLFIDEKILLDGIIDFSQVVVSNTSLYSNVFAPFTNTQQQHGLIICADKVVALEKDLFHWNGYTALAFLDIVYSYSPYPDEYGNMMRHIVSPLNELLQSGSLISEAVSSLTEYVEYYSSTKHDKRVLFC